MKTLSTLLLSLLFVAGTSFAADPATPAKAPAAPATAAKPAATPTPAKSDARSSGGAVKTASAGSQQNRMKECNKQATGKKGDERRAFMKSCLSSKNKKAA